MKQKDIIVLKALNKKCGFICACKKASSFFRASCTDLNPIETYVKRIFGSFEPLYVNDTYQFDDYSKYVVTMFDENKKAKAREEQFPKDCEAAFDMGVKFSNEIKITNDK